MGAYFKLIYCVRGVEGEKRFVLLEIASIGIPSKLCITQAVLLTKASDPHVTQACDMKAVHHPSM